MMMQSLPTDTDRDHAWRHAFEYAVHEQRCEDVAAEYAVHYAKLIADEPEPRYWPCHSTVYFAWIAGR